MSNILLEIVGRFDVYCEIFLTVLLFISLTLERRRQRIVNADNRIQT